MTRGGRESGGADAEAPRTRGDAIPRAGPALAPDPAAAEPAAHGVGGTDICPDCYHPHPDFRFIPGTRTLKHSYKLHERIRALEEAERTCKAANESHRKTLAVLEAELASWRTELASWRTEAERLGDKAVENGARAEKAEAELEREPVEREGGT